METYIIPLFIDSSIITATVYEENYDFCVNEHTTEIKYCLTPKKELNQDIFLGLITKGPEEVRKLADITDVINKFCKDNTIKTPFNGFFSGITRCSFAFEKHIDSIGEITIECSDIEQGELGTYDTSTDTTVKIPCVVFIKHRYYALTKKLVEWLNITDKPRRATVLTNLFY